MRFGQACERDSSQCATPGAVVGASALGLVVFDLNYRKRLLIAVSKCGYISGIF